MKLLVLAGTRDGRFLAREFAGRGHEVLVSTLTEYGAELAEAEGLRVRYGAFSAGELDRVLESGAFDAVIDATHPYAQNIRAIAQTACTGSGTAYFRWERPASAGVFSGKASSGRERLSPGKKIYPDGVVSRRGAISPGAVSPGAVSPDAVSPDAVSPEGGIPPGRVVSSADKSPTKEGRPQGGIYWAQNLTDAAGLAAGLGERILLTTGSNGLPEWLGQAVLKDKTLFVRVLPTAKVLQRCEELGLKPRQIIAAQGPFSREWNEAMMAQLGIQVVVAKDSGREGGTPAKILACSRRGIPLVLLKRPSQVSAFLSPSEFIVKVEDDLWKRKSFS
ncbi:precorrin-6A reductase [Acididesulfobacillus acetoxydans]|uniref:Cobalt-precorrin 6A reductase n=1 Tax=Acididesulfobacillus acetoxydans TaxID=1561005 RepID=A0A8S0XXQ9_9FIRM|nr:precorrin-6A/cobalt-precorrin-6A reductase [Acididesulfobacillus acetoxydans]CAA7601907.1 precorrin-6A reductase [Acididesulfobacillus acetoxydans]CEJ08249.1 Cobalt-precorrin 6A reductase [Acididesulfobacillus acetoxydans]